MGRFTSMDNTARVASLDAKNTFSTEITKTLSGSVLIGGLVIVNAKGVIDYVIIKMAEAMLTQQDFKTFLTIIHSKNIKRAWKLSRKTGMFSYSSMFTIARTIALTQSDNKFSQFISETLDHDRDAYRAMIYHLTHQHGGSYKKMEEEALALRSKDTAGKWNISKKECYKQWLATIR